MQNINLKLIAMISLTMVGLGASPVLAFGADQAGNELTLWQTLVSGGMVMIVIGFLSLVAVAIVLYDLTTLHSAKLTPPQQLNDIIKRIETKDLAGAIEITTKNNNVLSKIAAAGLNKAIKKAKKEDIDEAVTQQARAEIGMLWQNINYLSDIVAIAPLLGLLGTVLGMIQAFHAVPIQSAGVKTALLAAGISKAMIATAAGLIVAIPSQMAYSYFRGKVQELTHAIEAQATEIIKALQA